MILRPHFKKSLTRALGYSRWLRPSRSGADGDKWSNYGCILKKQPSGFADLLGVYVCVHVSTRRRTQAKREVSDNAEFLKNLILACVLESYHVLLEEPVWRGWRE